MGTQFWQFLIKNEMQRPKHLALGIGIGKTISGVLALLIYVRNAPNYFRSKTRRRRNLFSKGFLYPLSKQTSKHTVGPAARAGHAAFEHQWNAHLPGSKESHGTPSQGAIVKKTVEGESYALKRSGVTLPPTPLMHKH